MQIAEYLISKKGKIMNLAIHYGLDNENAKDIFQNVSVKLLEKASAFRGESSFDTFVYKITKNEILMYLRSKRISTKNNYTYYLVRQESETPEQLVIKSARNTSLNFLLNSAHVYLNENDADTLKAELEFILEDEYASDLALAETLNVPITTVKNRRYYMRKSLRNIFDKELFF